MARQRDGSQQDSFDGIARRIPFANTSAVQNDCWFSARLHVPNKVRVLDLISASHRMTAFKGLANLGRGDAGVTSGCVGVSCLEIEETDPKRWRGIFRQVNDMRRNHEG
jgi:hypothetical protein